MDGEVVQGRQMGEATGASPSKKFDILSVLVITFTGQTIKNI